MNGGLKPTALYLQIVAGKVIVGRSFIKYNFCTGFGIALAIGFLP